MNIYTNCWYSFSSFHLFIFIFSLLSLIPMFHLKLSSATRYNCGFTLNCLVKHKAAPNMKFILHQFSNIHIIIWIMNNVLGHPRLEYRASYNWTIESTIGWFDIHQLSFSRFFVFLLIVFLELLLWHICTVCTWHAFSVLNTFLHFGGFRNE